MEIIFKVSNILSWELGIQRCRLYGPRQGEEELTLTASWWIALLAAWTDFSAQVGHNVFQKVKTKLQGFFVIFSCCEGVVP